MMVMLGGLGRTALFFYRGSAFVRFIGLLCHYNVGRSNEREDKRMIIHFLKKLLHSKPLREEDRAMDAEFEPYREALGQAGLSEEELRHMDPDDRVAVLEQAKLDPYNYIYLACG